MTLPTVPEIYLYFQGYKDLTPEKTQALTESWGFKSKCVRFLAQQLGISAERPWKWGKGLEFAQMPPLQFAQLAILYFQRKLAEKDEVIRRQREYIRQLENRQSFRRAA